MAPLATNPGEHGACAVCDHGRGHGGRCMLPGRPVPLATARSREGHCGPEAHHLRIGGDDLAPRASLPVTVHRHGQAA
jgi:hypothetical protein